MQKKTAKVISVGNFDGVHLGHQVLIGENIRLARSLGANSHVISFLPHPVQYFTHEQNFLLLDVDEKIRLLMQLGIDSLEILDFASIVELSAHDFFYSKLLALNPVAFVVGKNFNFGKNGSGDAALLATLCSKHGISCHSMDLAQTAGQQFSSSAIRDCIRVGNFRDANAMLGRPYTLAGIVVRGAGLARQLRCPTANVAAPDQVLPACGSYASIAIVDGERHFAITAVTKTPSTGAQALRLETHVLADDIDFDFYDKFMQIQFLHFIRAETKFSDFHDLMHAIHADISMAKQFHGISALATTISSR
ncbi:MAG: riboflavin biosynthesis protein RibF [Bradymonadales bacterium]|jgi:riboflavin kinase/FMN adenylyltransferase